MIKGKKRGAESTGDDHTKKPKFDKKSPAKGKFDSQNAEKKPFKKSGESFKIHEPWYNFSHPFIYVLFLCL